MWGVQLCFQFRQTRTADKHHKYTMAESVEAPPGNAPPEAKVIIYCEGMPRLGLLLRVSKGPTNWSPVCTLPPEVCLYTLFWAVLELTFYYHSTASSPALPKNAANGWKQSTQTLCPLSTTLVCLAARGLGVHVLANTFA